MAKSLIPKYEHVQIVVLAILLLVIPVCALPADSQFTYPERFGIGEPLPAERFKTLTTAIPPDGEGLPPGSGNFEQGEIVYQLKCQSCHGFDLTGTPAGKPLIGGLGSLTTATPLKTVESFWPYATSVFSYIRNTMPTTDPGSLTDSEVYALMAFILASADIVPRGIVLNAKSLPAVRMPNKDGFVPDPRPDVSISD